MAQQLVLEPLGLVTEPNPLGQIPAGGMFDAYNTVIRSPGIIEGLPNWAVRATIPSDAGTTSAFVVATPGPYMLVIFDKIGGWFYCWFDQTSGAQLFGGAAQIFVVTNGNEAQSINTSVQPGFCAQVIGDQIFVNMYSNVVVWDTYKPTNAATAKPRQAGVQAPTIRFVQTITTPVGLALPAGSYAFYVAIIRRTVGDKVTLSAPSAAAYGDSFAAGTACNLNVEVRLMGSHYAGDVVEIYRTKSKPSGVTGAAFDYQRGEEAGAEYQKVTGYTLTAADITATTVTIKDTVDDDRLGEALYTNQALQGQGAAAYPPPALDLMAVYKGSLFGFGTTRPPAIELRPKGLWQDFSTLPDTRAPYPFSLGSVSLDSCTWTTGGSSTVVTVTPSSEIKYVHLGARAESFLSGLSGTVTAVGASTFTVTPAATVARTNEQVNFYDQAFVSTTGTVSMQSWGDFLVGLGTVQSLEIIAPALQLNKHTATRFQASPVDGFSLVRRALLDNRNVFTFASSGETNYDPIIANYNSGTPTSATIERKPAAMVWSENNEPEAWPFVNVDYFSKGTPCAVVGTRDALVVFCTDGIWRISGTGGSAGEGYDWRADLIATNITVAGTQAICALNDVVYAMTSDGLVAIDSGSTGRKITQGRVHDQLQCPPWTDGPYTTSTATFLVADEEHNEVLMREPSASGGRIWIYNTNTDRLTQTIAHEQPFHGDYSRFLRNPLIIGKDGSSTWTVKAPTGAYGNFSVGFADVYADNPFGLREWQSLEWSLSNPLSGTYAYFNGNVTDSGDGTAGQATYVYPKTDGRVGIEVPRDSPRVGNTMRVHVYMAPDSATKTQLYGFALNYKDHSDRRRSR